jgi:hypothetical protein
MIHFLPDPDTAVPARSDPVALRAGGLARALEVVERISGEPSGLSHAEIAARLALAGDSRMLDLMSERAVAASAAGLEAIALLTESGGTANPAAARLLADNIRDALDEMGALLSL